MANAVTQAGFLGVFWGLHGLSEEPKPLQTAKGEVLSQSPVIYIETHSPKEHATQ